MKKITLLIIILLGSFLLTGCGAASPTPNKEQTPDNQTQEESSGKFLPSAKGPSSLPNMTGPSEPLTSDEAAPAIDLQ